MTFEDMIPRCDYWYIRDDETIIGETDGGSKFEATNALLTATHSLLPTVARALINRNYSPGYLKERPSLPAASSLSMLYTTRMLYKEPLRLLDVYGETRVISILSDIEIDKKTNIATLDCAVVDIEETTIAGTDVLLAKTGRWRDVHCSLSHLNTQYPAWLDRVAMVSSLGEDLDDWIHSIFSNPLENKLGGPFPDIMFT